MREISSAVVTELCQPASQSIKILHWYPPKPFPYEFSSDTPWILCTTAQGLWSRVASTLKDCKRVDWWTHANSCQVSPDVEIVPTGRQYTAYIGRRTLMYVWSAYSWQVRSLNPTIQGYGRRQRAEGYTRIARPSLLGIRSCDTIVPAQGYWSLIEADGSPVTREKLQ